MRHIPAESQYCSNRRSTQLPCAVSFMISGSLTDGFSSPAAFTIVYFSLFSVSYVLLTYKSTSHGPTVYLAPTLATGHSAVLPSPHSEPLARPVCPCVHKKGRISFISDLSVYIYRDCGHWLRLTHLEYCQTAPYCVFSMQHEPVSFVIVLLVSSALLT